MPTAEGRVKRRRQRNTVCAVIVLAFLVGAVFLVLFYLAEPKSARAAILRLFGKEADVNNGFTLPTRPRVTITPEASASEAAVKSHLRWFSQENIPFHSAILIAGSRGYENYRHQADLCHAFQLLKQGKVPVDQIITFLYDDVAHHPDNPYPGQIFNRPGCNKDYTGWEVHKDTVLAVLKGDKSAVKGKGSGRVLRQHPLQKVFFFYSDHGSTGSIAMPQGPPIFADELHYVLEDLVRKDHFNEMVIYLEACDAGSMFQGFHMERVLAVAASDAYESSYATYCPDLGHQTRVQVPNASYIGSCMGDLFSVSWMEDTEKIDVAEDAIEEQFNRVRLRTSNYQMYLYGSHVIKYGDRQRYITKQVVGNFLSYFAAPSGWTRSESESLFLSNPFQNGKQEGPIHAGYDQRTADLLYLYRKSHQNDDGSASGQLQEEIRRRHRTDVIIRGTIQDLFDQNRLPSGASVEDYATKEVFARYPAQVVDDWNCLREITQSFEHNCATMNDYSRQYTRTFANLCNAGVVKSTVESIFVKHCQVQAA